VIRAPSLTGVPTSAITHGSADQRRLEVRADDSISSTLMQHAAAW
jgi:hypothetical protein